MAKLGLDDLPIKPFLDQPHLEEKLGVLEEDGAPEVDENPLSKETVQAVFEGHSEESLLRPTLDREELAETFERNGAVRVNHVFRPEVAEYLYEDIRERLSWNLRYYDCGERQTLSEEEWESYSREEQRALRDRIGEGARELFQSFYYRHSLDPADGNHLIDRLPRYIEREEFQGLIESISGMTHDKPIEAWATRLESGHFLRMHRDGHVKGFASTLQFTKQWSPDWGGVLCMADHDGNVLRSFAPKFNSFVMFKLPTIHYVSVVAPYANGARYIVSMPGGTK